ncbi:MAG: NACHT domain-containing protein, partial [Burkholderiaceae bacterium]|nr:NACHT domain-containing protein [Burkholderiaceae bacterium]
MGQHIEQHVSAELGQVERLLVEIRDNLARQQPRLSVDDLRAMEVRYRQSIVEWFETLTFQGMSPSGTPIALPLRKVYVELKAVADVPEAADTYSADERRLLLEAEEDGRYERSELIAHLDAMRLERWRSEARKERKQATKLERRSISEVLNDETRRGLVILGDPGSGKSTLLHYLALTAAEYGPGGVLPIFVPFAAYDDHRRRTNQDTSLGDFLAIYYDKWRSQVGLGPLFAAALEAGRCLVLLDGLDEVLDTTTRQHVAQQTTAMIQHWQGRGNRFVVTSRVVGYREAMLAGNLPHVTVLDFGRPEIELFARQWCRAYEVWVAGGRETTTALREAAVQEKALLEDVRGNPSVEQLAANPLLLTMLAMLRRQVGKLPDRRIELYDKYLKTMLVHWGTGRSPGAHTQKIERFDKHRATAYLIDLAFWLQCNRPSGTATRAELERQLVAIALRFKQIDPRQASPEQQLSAQQDAEAFVRDMRHFAGLLAERGRDAFGFLHLTFQEYFAGRALARLTPEERWAQIAPVLHQPRWREPILLCAGQLGVMEQRRDEVTELVRCVLNASSEHEAILHRDLFLAASVAADDVGVAPTLLKEIYDRLTPLLRSAVPTLRDMAIVAIAHLGRVGCEPAVGTLTATLEDRGLCIPVMRATAFLLGDVKLVKLRDALRERLSDAAWDVRRAAVSALGPLAASDGAIQGAL